MEKSVMRHLLGYDNYLHIGLESRWQTLNVRIELQIGALKLFPPGHQEKKRLSQPIIGQSTFN